MKIYTYYDDMDREYQQEIIDLWKESWSSQGFDPHVLSKKDAQQHSYYKDFLRGLKYLNLEIKGEENIHPYVLSCHLRWLAYATRENEIFYVSDYDVINKCFKPTEPEKNKIHFMDHHCPCLASGKAEYFEEFSKDIINISKKNILKLKQDGDSIFWYHDQQFLVSNQEHYQERYLLSTDHETLWNIKIKHFSWDYVNTTTGASTNVDVDKQRIKLINEFIENNA